MPYQLTATKLSFLENGKTNLVAILFFQGVCHPQKYEITNSKAQLYVRDVFP